MPFIQDTQSWHGLRDQVVEWLVDKGVKTTDSTRVADELADRVVKQLQSAHPSPPPPFSGQTIRQLIWETYWNWMSQEVFRWFRAHRIKHFYLDPEDCTQEVLKRIFEKYGHMVLDP